jgi:mxaJ protein
MRRTLSIPIVALFLCAFARAEPPLSASSHAPNPAPAKARRQFRVCADGNNLPFSNERGEGFENKLALLVAKDLDADVIYTWWPQRRGFFRETLKAKKCDVVMGVPSKLDIVTTTRPYYRSGYVFVYGPNAPHVASLDVPELHSMRIGVPMVGDDGANPPPVLALASRGLIGNMRAYSVYGDYREDSPPADAIRALRRGDIDIAIAWGPVAGYYATRPLPALSVEMIPEADAPPGFTFAFDIAMGVRRDDKDLASELDAVLARRVKQVDAVLASYGLPRL